MGNGARSFALTGEVGELVELFQWASADGDEVSRERTGEGMADVPACLPHLTNWPGIDLGEAVTAKMDADDARFGAGTVSGVAPQKR